MVKKTNGSADFNPNFPATDADDHNTEKVKPVKMYCGKDCFKVLLMSCNNNKKGCLL
jgi:hypothetical protein